jgi:DNA-binding NarL/FixJ family response regulator
MSSNFFSRIAVEKNDKSSPIRVFVVEDHNFVRDALRMMFVTASDIRLVGEASNGIDAVASAKELRPDVCIMDISMNGLNGIDATRQIIAFSPETRVLAFSASLKRQYVQQMLQVGASGYIVKTCSGGELIAAVRAIARGERYFSPEILAPLSHERGEADDETDPGESSLLSLKERTVVQLIANGKSTKEIADILDVSVRTVDTHRGNILRKTGASSVADLVKFALKEGIAHL